MTDKKTKVKTDPKDLWLEDTVDDKQLIEQLRVEFDSLAKKYNKQQEKVEGLETHNAYLEEQMNELKTAIDLLQKARPLVQVATSANEEKSIAMTDEGRHRNPNVGYWIKFDLSNVEITRPLINIIMRMKDRPKQFYIEILGDDVVEVAENKP